MRKIEQAMLAAVQQRKFWISGNTCVDYVEAGNPNGPRSEIFLHGNHIADYWHQSGTLDVDSRTLALWPTPTTKSRLRALGASVYTKKGTTYLDGQVVA